MTKRDYRDYLQDIYNSIDEIESFVQNMEYKDFCYDKKTKNAVERSVEIIGEATKNIPDYIRNKYPAVPWKNMAGMRDKLIHVYFNIDTEILWMVAKKDIPAIKDIIHKIVKELVI